MDSIDVIDTADLADADPLETVEASAPRDYDAEAKQHGWTPRDQFRGDPALWKDAESFMRKADEAMPLLRKQNETLKRQMKDLQTQVRKAQDFYSKAEQRAYSHAMNDLQARMDDAVDVGDKHAAKTVAAEMSALEKDVAASAAPSSESDNQPTPDQLKAELTDWMESNDWYGTDELKTKYAEMQADLLGPAANYTEGRKAWFAEVTRRVESKFSAKRAPITTGTGQPAPSRGGKAFTDLPPEAQRACDKWVKSGIIKSRSDYIKSYQWD